MKCKNKATEARSSNRSGLLIAKNDELIYAFLKDENYYVMDNGVLMTCISKQGHVTDVWRVKPLTLFKGYIRFEYKYKRIRMNIVMYAAFVGKLEDDLVVNHIDGNSTNNTPDNLELITQLENRWHQQMLVDQARLGRHE